MTANRHLQPKIDDLMTAFLARQATAIAAGQEAVACGDVVAYEAVPAQAVDPRLAWDGAIEAIRHFAPNTKLPTKLPAGWSGVINALPSAMALPMAVGNFPQSVRDLPALLETAQFEDSISAESLEDVAMTSATESFTKSDQPIDWLFALGLMRLTHQFESAVRFIAEKSKNVPKDLANAWANERAVLAWQMGDRNQATKIWNSLPASAPVNFNRGVAELFVGSPSAACQNFKSAIAEIPESSSWHHLGRLYLALAESR